MVGAERYTLYLVPLHLGLVLGWLVISIEANKVDQFLSRYGGFLDSPEYIFEQVYIGSFLSFVQPKLSIVTNSKPLDWWLCPCP